MTSSSPSPSPFLPTVHHLYTNQSSSVLSLHYSPTPSSYPLSSHSLNSPYPFIASSSKGEIYHWRSHPSAKSEKWLGHGGRVNQIQYSNDGGLVASASDDGTVRLWSHRMSENSDSHGDNPISPVVCQPLKGHTAGVKCVDWAEKDKNNGKLLLSGGDDGVVMIWKIGQKDSINHNKITNSISKKSKSTPSSDNKNNNSHLLISHSLSLLSHSTPILSSSFSPDGFLLLSSSTDSTYKLWDIETQKHIYTHVAANNHNQNPRDSLPITHVKFLPLSSSIVVSAEGGGGLAISDLRVKSVIQMYNLWGGGRSTSLSFRHDGYTILATGKDDLIGQQGGNSSIKLLDIRMGNLLSHLHAHSPSSIITSSAFSPSGKHFITGATDKCIIEWNYLNGKQESGKLSKDSNNNNKYLISEKVYRDTYGIGKKIRSRYDNIKGKKEMKIALIVMGKERQGEGKQWWKGKERDRVIQSKYTLMSGKEREEKYNIHSLSSSSSPSSSSPSSSSFITSLHTEISKGPFHSILSSPHSLTHNCDNYSHSHVDMMGNTYAFPTESNDYHHHEQQHHTHPSSSIPSSSVSSPVSLLSSALPIHITQLLSTLSSRIELVAKTVISMEERLAVGEKMVQRWERKEREEGGEERWRLEKERREREERGILQGEMKEKMEKVVGNTRREEFERTVKEMMMTNNGENHHQDSDHIGTRMNHSSSLTPSSSTPATMRTVKKSEKEMVGKSTPKTHVRQQLRM